MRIYSSDRGQVIRDHTQDQDIRLPYSSTYLTYDLGSRSDSYDVSIPYPDGYYYARLANLTKNKIERAGIELLARVRALLRRCRQSHPQDEELAEDLTLTEHLYVAMYRGKKITLSAHEWNALRRLATTVGSVVPREELKSLLWGDDTLMHDGELDRCMDQLNRKLSDEAPAVDAIKTVPGGFRLTTPASDEPGGLAVH